MRFYFRKGETQLGRVDVSIKSVFNKSGWLSGYRAYFDQRLGIRFEEGPANLELLEEVVIARNRVQHPESITSNRTKYSRSDVEKLSHPFFLDESERDSLAIKDEEVRSWLRPPTLHVTEEKLSTAIDQVEKFADWLEVEIKNRIYRR